MTLKRLRDLHPADMHNDEALRSPPRQPYRHYALEMPVKVKAHTLAQLRRSFDWRGSLAVGFAEWSAVFAWLRMTKQGEWAITTVALIAGSYARRMKRWDSGLEKKDRTELKELGTLAAACREAWRRVGQPGLRESIREARHQAEVCERMDAERAARRAAGLPA
jgi:hypothetical protein